MNENFCPKGKAKPEKVVKEVNKPKTVNDTRVGKTGIS